MPTPPMTKEAQDAYEEALRRIKLCRHMGQIGIGLNLSGLGLTQVPPEIGQLSSLTHFALFSNQLTSLPPEIGQLSALTDLNLSDNQFTSLPPQIGKLSALTTIALHNNRLTSLPPEIGQLSALTELRLDNNQLTSLPPEIGQLRALTELNLLHNQLASLPPEIGQLKALTVLSLDNNQLTSLPPEIGQLSALTELRLDNNQLTSLPPEIGQLRALTELNLLHNQLASLPPEIGQLKALTVLSLDNNQLASLPPEIGQLSALTELFINDNQLTSLPPEIGQLSALTELFINDNQLTSLPPEIGQLRALTELFINDNQLTSLPPEIGQLTALTRLDLNNNQLTSLPQEIGHLTSLILLQLSNNQLTSLPSEQGNLRELMLLTLEGNSLGYLPESLQGLTKLKELTLHGNTALGLPAEVLGPRFRASNVDNPPAKPQAILDYYFAQQKGTRPLNEVKLLLVGRGEAGKTSVSRALRGEVFQKEQEETPGIEIRPWVLACPGGEPVKVHVWDFAGQEITHETHRFFLTERSLYVVVLDGRGGQQMEEAEYWLSHVERYGSRKDGDKVEHSPVIVVLNKWRSPGPYDVEKRRLQREHPNIRAFVETDCLPKKGEKTGHGIDTLRETICAVLEQMPAVRQAWPLTYFQVRQKLDELVSHKDATKRRHFLNWEAYRQVCVDCGVTDQGAQMSLAENLNALGVALYYGDDERLRDTRVLNPNWAANGLYGLVRGVHRKPFDKKPGQLWQGEFSAVLAEGMEGMNQERGATIEDYPAERDGVRVHEFLLELMQDRELGFLAGEHQNEPLYLLPGLLTLDEPEPKDYDVAAHMEQAQLRFRYLYELLPAGVMSRFIVRTHPLSDDYYRWQRGAVLGWGHARALVMAERRRNPRVDVFVVGGSAAERQELAGVVRANMDEIHRGLPDGLKGQEELDLSVPGEQYESVEKLEQLETQNMPVQIMTRTGAQNLPVTPELEQVQPAKARRKSAPKLKVFVSYAHTNYKVWDKLKPHLDVLKNERLVSWWYDGKIRPGSEWDDAIRKEMKEADIVILLLSTAFFASKYIKGVELQEARRRQQSGVAEILPVLLEPSEAFAQQKWLSKLQTVPSQNGQLRPLTSFNPSVNGWNQVQKALREMIAEVAARRGAVD
ncbi:MAG: leucine-rich repeat domain-containing protein [Verrucomicrobiaceae bacterium]|nr:leucine-rich repeat domain-containing protein [Verrucomicrobiaceae bacterium]